MHLLKRLLVTLTITFMVVVAAAAPGSAAVGVDTSFGSGGSTAGSLSGADRAGAVAIQSTGRILFTVTNAANKWKVGRLNTNGTLDTSFGVGGYWTGTDGTAADLAVDKDDNILVVGRDQAPMGGNYGTLLWLAPNGTPAAGFPAGGTKCGCDYSRVAVSNSRIYVSGQESNPDTTYAAINRYHLTGNLDYGFGFDGLTFTPVPGSSPIGSAPSLDVDSAGLPVALISTADQTQLVKKVNNGAPDSAYGGVVPGNPTSTTGLSVLPNNHAVAGLIWADHANFTFFDGAGQVASSIALPAGATPRATAVTKAGAVVLAYSHGNEWGLIRANQSGLIDTTFGNQGWLTQSTNFNPRAMTADRDGRVVLVGGTSDGADWVATRVDIDGTAPPAMDWFTQMLLNFFRWLLSIFGITI